MGTPWIHGRDPLTSLVTLRKIDHPSYKRLEWKFRAEVLELTTNYWPIVQGCSGDGALGYWKVIANLFELDEMTSRSLLRTSRIGNIGSLEILMSVPHTTRRTNMILVHVKRLKIVHVKRRHLTLEY